MSLTIRIHAKTQLKYLGPRLVQRKYSQQQNQSTPEGTVLDFALQKATYRLLQQHLQFGLSYACQHLWLWSCAGRSSPGVTTLEPMPTHRDLPS